MLTELKTLIAVARYGTFAAAGDRIGLTQSAVSGQMKRLEELLGKQIFVRTGRAATLNETGHLVLVKASDILRMADTLIHAIDTKHQTGRLRVGAIASTHPSILCEALPNFNLVFPKIKLQIVPGTSLDLLDQLDADGLDLALIIKPGFGTPQNLTWEGLEQERFVLIAPKEWNIDDWRSDISNYPFLRYNRNSFGGRLVNRFLNQKGIIVNDWVELDDIPTILEMVAGGLGLAIVPKARAYASAFNKVQIISLESPDFIREIGIIRKAGTMGMSVLFAEQCKKMTAI